MSVRRPQCGLPGRDDHSRASDFGGSTNLASGGRARRASGPRASLPRRAGLGVIYRAHPRRSEILIVLVLALLDSSVLIGFTFDTSGNLFNNTDFSPACRCSPATPIGSTSACHPSVCTSRGEPPPSGGERPQGEHDTGDCEGTHTPRAQVRTF